MNSSSSLLPLCSLLLLFTALALLKRYHLTRFSIDSTEIVETVNRSFDKAPLAVVPVFPSLPHGLENLDKIEKGLVKARLAIRHAIITHMHISTRKEEFIPRGVVYRNAYAFHQLSPQ